MEEEREVEAEEAVVVDSSKEMVGGWGSIISGTTIVVAFLVGAAACFFCFLLTALVSSLTPGSFPRLRLSFDRELFDAFLICCSISSPCSSRW